MWSATPAEVLLLAVVALLILAMMLRPKG